MHPKFLIAGLMALGVTAPAMAGGLDPAPVDPVPTVPVPVPTPVASDFDWTGFSLGGQLGYGTVTSSGPSLDGRDALYGLRGYYDMDLGNLIVGGGVQYDATGIDLDGAADITGVLRLAGRAGAGVGPNWFYGTGGFARAFTDDGTASPGDSNGYFVGAGVERAVTDNVTAGAELLYHAFSDFDVDTLDVEATTLSASVNYRF